jgi:heme/copper-type cytochrome/quinol oxidase subunit 2
VTRAGAATRAVAVAAALWALAPGAAHACQACFGAKDTPMIDGARAGAWALIALTLTVQGAFAGFFFYLRRRFKRAAADDRAREARAAFVLRKR